VAAIVNKSFSLIYLLPNQIMRWMGSSAESDHGAAEMAKEAKGGFDSGAGQGQKALEAGHAKANEKTGDNLQSGESRQEKIKGGEAGAEAKKAAKVAKKRK